MMLKQVHLGECVCSMWMMLLFVAHISRVTVLLSCISHLLIEPTFRAAALPLAPCPPALSHRASCLFVRACFLWGLLPSGVLEVAFALGLPQAQLV